MTKLKIQDLVVKYDGLKALRGITLEAEQGDIVGIWGPNMAGKSSLLKAISGVVLPNEGKIELSNGLHDNYDISMDSMEKRLESHKIFFAPEASGIFPSLSVEENLLLTPRVLCRMDIAENLEAIYQLFPLLHERRRLPARFLSGGWRQILAVCRAKMIQPQILLCDEPCLGLSPPMATLVLQTLKDMRNNSNKFTMIFLTEQKNERLRGYCDKVYKLDRGELTPE